MKVPVLFIYSPNLDFLGKIAVYSSARLKRGLSDIGDFELHVPTIPENFRLLQPDNLAFLDGDGKRGAIINDVVVKSGLSGKSLAVTGQALNCLTSFKCSINLSNYAALNYGYDNVPEITAEDLPRTLISIETILKEYARRHLKGVKDMARNIPLLDIANDFKRGKKTLWSSEPGTPLNELLQNICTFGDCGYEICADLQKKRLIFDIIVGNDRGFNQSQNRTIVFSESNGNLSEITYALSRSNYKNVGYAAGEGEYENRAVIDVYRGKEPLGMARKEIWLDCGNAPMIKTQTQSSLEFEGLHRLDEYKIVESLKATVAVGTNFGDVRYLRDFDLGDNVGIFFEEIGARQNMRISGIEEIYEPNKITVNAEFGNPTAPIQTINNFFKNFRR